MALKFNLYPQQSSPGYYNQGTPTDPYAAMDKSARDLGEMFGTSLAEGRQRIREIGGLGPLGKAWRKYKKSPIDPVSGKPWVDKVPMNWKQFKKSSYGQAHKEKIKYDRVQRRKAAAAKRDAWGEKVAGNITGFPEKVKEAISPLAEKASTTYHNIKRFGPSVIQSKLPSMPQGFPTPNLEKIRDLDLTPHHGGLLGKIFTPQRHAIRKQAATGEFVTPAVANLSGLQRALPAAQNILGSKEKQFADWYDYVQGLTPYERQSVPLDQLSFLLEHGGWGGGAHGPDKIGSVIEKQGYRNQ
jgi:hypothetical protein